MGPLPAFLAGLKCQYLPAYLFQFRHGPSTLITLGTLGKSGIGIVGSSGGSKGERGGLVFFAGSGSHYRMAHASVSLLSISCTVSGRLIVLIFVVPSTSRLKSSSAKPLQKPFFQYDLYKICDACILAALPWCGELAHIGLALQLCNIWVHHLAGFLTHVQ